MENGNFTKEERERLLSLDAVDEVRAKSIVYSKQFKEECMRRYHAGERPGDIFASRDCPRRSSATRESSAPSTTGRRPRKKMP